MGYGRWRWLHIVHEVPRLQRNVSTKPFISPSYSSHLISVSTIRNAVDLKQSFDQISAAEKSRKLSAEEKRKLEESAAGGFLTPLFAS
jgi:hypothetical protein